MRVPQTSPVVRWIFYSLLLIPLAVVMGVSAWFVVRPLETFRPLILAELQTATGAASVKIGRLSWTTVPMDLALGAKAEGVEVLRAPGIGIARLELPLLEARVQPLKLLFGKLPLKIVVRGGGAVVAEAPAKIKVPPPAAGSAEVAENKGKSIAHYVRADLDVRDFSLTIDPALAGSPGEDSTFKLSELSVSSNLSGFPGSFDLAVEGKTDIDLRQGQYIANGPFRFDLEGYFQTESERLVGVKLSRLDFDLSHTILGAKGLLEKTSTMDCKLEAKAQGILNPDGGLKAVQLEDTELKFGSVKMNLSGRYDVPESESTLHWGLVKTEVKDFHIPLAVWRHAPVSGVLESTGQLTFRGASPRAGNWRVALTQFRIDTENFSEVLDPSSKGTVAFSFVSEGAIDQGRISSPRTEFQLDGTEAQIEYGRGTFMKPAGHRLVALLRAGIKNDRLEFQNASLGLHTLELRGSGTLDGFSEWVRGGEGQLKFDLATDRTDLSQWTGYTAAMRKLPLEGFFEAVASFEGKIGGELGLSKLGWRVDRLSLASVRGNWEEESSKALGMSKGDWLFVGPFSAGFLLQGRGAGTVVERASLSTRVDLSALALKYKDDIRKPAGVPLLLDLAVQQSKNQLKISKGNLRFHELDMAFQGQVIQGSRRSFVDLSMAKPIRLSDWKQFFLKTPRVPLEGSVQWKGRVGFSGPSNFESKLDLAQLAVEGELQLRDLGGRVGTYRNSLRNGNGKLLVLPEGLVVPALSFEMGGAKVNLSGRLTPRGPGKDSVLARYMAAKGWEGALQLGLNRFDPADFAVTEIPPSKESAQAAPVAEPTLGGRLREAVLLPVVKQSQVKVGLQVGEGKFADVAFSDLNARALWSEGRFNLQPFGVKVFGGRVSGSVVFDATPAYLRKDPPQLSVSVKTAGVDGGAALAIYKPALTKIAGGLVDGDLTLSMHGFETSEWISSARGRLAGAVKGGHFDTLGALREALDGMALRSEAKSFLVNSYRKEQCLQKNFDAKIDIQVDEGRLTLDDGELRFATGSDVRLKGSIAPDLKTQLAGSFYASTGCIGGDVRGCLAGSDGRAVVPFRISGTAIDPKPELDSGALAKKVVACVGSKIRSQAETEVRKRLDDAKNGLEDQAKQKLKELFKRGG